MGLVEDLSDTNTRLHEKMKKQADEIARLQAELADYKARYEAALLDGSEDSTAPADYCMTCQHSWDDPCDTYPTCKETGSYAPADNEGERYVVVEWGTTPDYEAYFEVLDVRQGVAVLTTTSSPKAHDHAARLNGKGGA